ncbi:FAD-binding oxidoreductase [Rugosimonospora africana]|uniref:FAD-linked oxidase n=1 Tax=Rugosimonospora africana TaxID=556532 RepID=A0A8J3VUZ1_9ACTN|nr:FAD-linked oxidase C-terminal domain-containing protein [Rugosimonospora africana]GIH19256.1 FAD-linked oxidase [Rugosimonospora africana]
MTGDALSAVLDEGVLVTDPDRMEGFRRDSADFAEAGMPMAVVSARTVDDVSRTLRWASEHRTPVVPRGAGTGLSGAAAALDGCIVLSTAGMTAIRQIAADDLYAVVEPGVINADLGRAAAEHGLFYPPDPSSFEISTIGGNLATNAGGLRCVKYGVTRESVLGLQVVLADGRVIRTGARTVKNVAGYDLSSLFVGSEGTLGIITEATLRLRPAPAATPATMVATFGSLVDAGRAVASIVRSGLAPSLLELMDHASVNLIEDYRPMGLDRSVAALLIAQADSVDAQRQADAMAARARDAGAALAMASTDPVEADMLLQARRIHYQAVEAAGRVLTEDIGVPRSRLAELLGGIEEIGRRYSLLIATVGHAGDGNMHPAIVLPRDRPDAVATALRAADEICRFALRLDGTISGEHGIGTLKRGWLSGQLDEATYAAHRAVKSTFDPLGILNPGRAL